MPHGAALALLLLASPPDSPRQGAGDEAVPSRRSIRTFQPGPGQAALEPPSQVVQLLLDRQEKEDHDSYLLQVLFRGKPAVERTYRVFADRVEIDFLDTGRPSMRLARVRGGALESSSLQELHYREARPGGKASGPLRRMVRLTLYLEGRPDLRFRNTLDRTFIHFRLPRKAGKAGNRNSAVDTGGR